MQIVETKNALEEILRPFKKEKRSIGFVPTMGALHQGHVSLIQRSKAQNEVTVCSIFVNPTQFNNSVDLDNYPRTLHTDILLLQKADCDILFVPSVKEMYPEKDRRLFDFGQLDKVMEGKYRNAHFNGVALIVSKLFDSVCPDKSYFGEKDYQQLLIVKELVRQEQYAVEIMGCSIVRERDGLAMSSRNALLSEEERKIAPIIYQCLQKAQNRAATHSLPEVKKWVSEQINKTSLLQLEYFEIADVDTLTLLDEWDYTKPAIGCIAVYLGKVRLIDNIKIFFPKV